MASENEARRAIAKELGAESILDPKVLQAEAAMRDAPARGGRRAEGRGCACWRGQLCRFHNLMYHGVI